MTFTTKAELKRRNAWQREELVKAGLAVTEAERATNWAEGRRDTAERALEEAQAALAELHGIVAPLRAQRDKAIEQLTDKKHGIRLSVLGGSGWSSLEDIDARAKWVLDGTVPERLTSDEGAKDEPTEKSEGASLGFSAIRPDDLVDVLRALEAVDRILDHLRKDPNLSVGKVRVQNAGIKLKGVLIDLGSIIRGV